MSKCLNQLHELIPESAWKRLGLILFHEEDVSLAKSHVNDMEANALFIINQRVCCDDWVELSSVSCAACTPTLTNTKVWLAKCDQVICYLPNAEEVAIPDWVLGLWYRAGIEQVPMQCLVHGSKIQLSPEQQTIGQRFCGEEDAQQQASCHELSELSLDYDYDDSCLWSRGHVSLDRVPLPTTLIRRFHLQCEEGHRLFWPYADDTDPTYDQRVENWDRELVCLAHELRQHLPNTIDIYVYMNGPFNYNHKTNINDIHNHPLSLQAMTALQHEMKIAGVEASEYFKVKRNAE
jgi:hypothetical protein